MAGRVTIYRLATLAGILAVWEGMVFTKLVNAFWISSPSLIFERSIKLLATGDLLRHTAVTLSEALAGLAGGMVVGVALGIVIGASRVVGQVLEPFIMAINSLPRVALAPLLVMAVGIGFASKFLLAFSLVVVIAMINTYEGIRSADPLLTNAMRLLGASRRQVFTTVLLPNSVPWMLASLRVSVAFAIVGAIVGEFISSRSGIGYMIDNASGAYDTTGIMVPLLVLMLCAVVLDWLIVLLTRYLLRWRPQTMRT
jgi:NitT/TauT family transport system permease protein